MQGRGRSYELIALLHRSFQFSSYLARTNDRRHARAGVQGNAADRIADHFVLADSPARTSTPNGPISPAIRRVLDRRKWRERRRRSS